MPGITHLVVMDLRQIVRRMQAERFDVETADRAKQRVGGDHAIALRADQSRLGRHQILLRVEHVHGGALAALRLLADAIECDGSRAHFGFRRTDRGPRTFVGDPCGDGGGARLIADLLQHQAALRGEFLGLSGLRGGGAAVVDRRGDLAEHIGLIGAVGAERGIGLPRAAGAALHGDGRIEAAFRDVDRLLGHVGVEARRQHRRVGAEGQCGGLIAAVRHQPHHRLGRAEPARRLTDDLRIGGLADSECDFGRVLVRQSAIEPRFRLRGVGRRDVAGVEPPLRHVQCFPQ